MENRKIFQKNFRINMSQQEHIEKSCKTYGISESEYFRRLIDSDMGKAVSVKTHEEFKISKDLIFEVNKIGNNINQIAKNTNSHYYTEYEKKKLFALMEKVKDLLWQLVGNVA